MPTRFLSTNNEKRVTHCFPFLPWLLGSHPILQGCINLDKLLNPSRSISAAAPSEASVRNPSQKRGWGLEEGESGYARGQGHSELGQRDLRGLGITCWQGCALSLTPLSCPSVRFPFWQCKEPRGSAELEKVGGNPSSKLSPVKTLWG